MFEQSGIRGVIINSRISEVFRKKIFSLQKAVKKASNRGGRQLNALLSNLEAGPRYRFKVYYKEVDVHQLKDENSQFRGEKRKLEESLVQEKAKRLRVDEKAREALEKAEKKGAFYKKKFIQLAKKVIKNGKKGRGPAKKKFNDYSKHHQKRIKNQLKDECQTTLSFLGLYNFVATKIEVLNTETNQYETFNLVGEGELPFTESDPKALDNDDIDNINMWLYLKDKFNISNEAWHEIAIKANGLPNTYSIKKRINELNSKWNLKPTPGDAEGVQLGFAESLQEHIVRLQKNGEINDGEAIKIKLSGDGTNIGKRLTVVNFTFTILNEKDVAMAEKGNYVLAVIKTTETYHNLRDSLADLQMEMANLKEIIANNCTYKIEYFLGGDLKFLALVCGLGRANQDYACVWYKCPREQRWDTSKTWSINDPKFGARTVAEIARFSTEKKFNCKAQPLFDFIPMDHVIIDTLHLFLRISDVLIDLFIRELRRSDAIEKKKNLL